METNTDSKPEQAKETFAKMLYRQRYDFLIIFGFCALLILFDQYTNVPAKVQGAEQQKQTATTPSFALPQIPAVLTTPEQRAEYLVVHYWDNFAFADTTLINNAEITEQAFVNYINLLPHTQTTVVEQSITRMLHSAVTGSSAMFENFTQLYEKYLYDPNSPFRQEDFYIFALRAIIDNKQVDDILKVRPRHQLEMALKNRVDDVATDFQYTVSNGRNSTMFRTNADYVLLFFNNPDCHDCARVKEYLSTSPVIEKMMKTSSHPSLRIIAVYPDEDIELWRAAHYPANWINVRSAQVREQQLYDLKAIPTLYLLDKKKRVLLKDAPVEIVEQYFNPKHK